MIYNLGNRIVNNYLVSTDDGYILIDTGYPNSFGRFQKKLHVAGIDPKDIKYVFLTHAHDDHAGFLNEVLDFTDAKVILHPKAVEGLKRGQNSFKGGCSGRIAYAFCLLLKLFGKGEHRYPSIRDEHLSRLITLDSEEFQRLGFKYPVIETPGHTVDHISLVIGDIMFCGDAAMSGFPSIRRTTIWVENLEQYKQSWETIIGKNPRMIYPAHGRPFKTEDLRRHVKTLERVKLYSLKG